MPDASAPRLSEPRLTHVALPCSDLDRTIAFYTSLTPLTVVARNEDANGRSAWLSNDRQSRDPFVLVFAEFPPDEAARFGQEPGRPAPTLAPFAHIGIEVPERADVDVIAERGRAMGRLHWEPRDMAEHIGYICALEDPDGNVIEFSHNQKVFSTVRALWGDGD
ncbi:MAG: VOC family protein [Acidimicrobiales bacterium]|nr:VOC family protein [Acidimicrobiales bacterium]